MTVASTKPLRSRSLFDINNLYELMNGNDGEFMIAFLSVPFSFLYFYLDEFVRNSYAVDFEGA